MRKKYYKIENRKKFIKDMVEKHGDTCMICGNTRSIVIDHDHQTGYMRGLLCSRHNIGLGLFLDSPEMLRKAANYLERNDTKSYALRVSNRFRSKCETGSTVILQLINDKSFKNDTERAKHLAQQFSLSLGSMKAKISRFRKKFVTKEGDTCISV